MAEQIIVFDTTLRDGEQAPGINLNAKAKVEIAEQLARLGVDVIEAGFPQAASGDFEAVGRSPSGSRARPSPPWPGPPPATSTGPPRPWPRPAEPGCTPSSPPAPSTWSTSCA